MRLRWSRGSVLAFGTQVRGFNPARSRRISQGEKIISTPSFGREVKPFVPFRRFTACKRSLNVTWKSGIFRQNSSAISRPSISSFHYYGLWWRHLAVQVGTTKDQGLYNTPSAAVHPGALAAGTLPQCNTTGINPLLVISIQRLTSPYELHCQDQRQSRESTTILGPRDVSLLYVRTTFNDAAPLSDSPSDWRGETSWLRSGTATCTTIAQSVFVVLVLAIYRARCSVNCQNTVKYTITNIQYAVKVFPSILLTKVIYSYLTYCNFNDIRWIPKALTHASTRGQTVRINVTAVFQVSVQQKRAMAKHRGKCTRP